MIPAVTVGVVVKKALELLASNEKGRKFLLYVLGITLFIVLLPLIMLVGLFGWMSGGEADVVIPNIVEQQIQQQYEQQYPEHIEALNKIKDTFGTYGLAEKVGLAQMIYVSSSLPDSNADDTFYASYADCFVNVSEEKTLTDNITEAFGVSFSDEDKEKINTMNGG